MKRLLAALVGGLGLGALVRHRRRRPAPELGPDPADELRAKIEESRADSGGDAESGVAEEPERAPLDPESRRHDVHERARRAIDDLGGVG